MNPVETIIFLQEREFSTRDYERFGIQALQKEGFRVEAWDISPVLDPEVYSPDLSPAPLPGGFLPVRFTGKGEILQALHNVGPSTLVMCIIGYSLRTLFVYRALSKREIPFAVIVTNILPLPERFTGTIRLDAPRKILSLLLNKLILRYYSLLGVRPAYLYLVGGERSWEPVRYPLDIRGGRTRILPIHTLDYDIYLQIRDTGDPADLNLAVFLDGNDFYHLDFRYMKEPVPAWMDTYFSELRRFFDSLEREIAVRVVIAAHPLAQYTPEQKAQFGGREVIQGRTADLVKRCKFAILHGSTAVNFAVLFEKPLLFITDQNYERYVMGPYIEAIAKELGKRPIYLDSPLPADWEKELQVDRIAYRSYRRSYIKTEVSEERPSWEILARFLKGT